MGPGPFGPGLSRGFGHEMDRLTLQRAMAGAGRPVDAARRARVERVTGQDLSHVRLHTGPAVRVAALAAGASGFTVGDDVAIAVGPGQAVPERLLIHELVHAAQQRAEGEATPAQAEQQARAVDSGAGVTGSLGAVGLMGTGRSYVAYAAADWLQSSPDVRTYGYSALYDELIEIDEWLDRQTGSTPEFGRMQQARAVIEDEITRRYGAVTAQNQPQRRRLEKEGETEGARLARALLANGASDRPGVLANLRMIDSIRPYHGLPGMAYLVHEGEMRIFPQVLADQVRAEVTSALRNTATSARVMNAGTQASMQSHFELNYEKQPVVGFIVSVLSRETASELEKRMMGPLRDSEIALQRFRNAERTGSLAEMGEAAYTAVEKAEEAGTIVSEGVDRSIAAAGSAVTGLTTTRDLAYTVSLSIGAILAAPVAASGVAGLGVTRPVASVLASLGTTGVVGIEGSLLGWVGGFGGELASGGGVHRAWSAGLSEGKRVGTEGALLGLNFGTTHVLANSLGVGASSLGVGAKSLSAWGKVWRSALAEAGGGGLSGAIGGYVSAPEGERGTSMLWEGLGGLGLGLLGGGSGAWAERFGSRVARNVVGLGVPAVGETGFTYWRTGDWGEAIRAGAVELITGAVMEHRSGLGPTPGEIGAHKFGRRSASKGRAFVTAAGIDLLSSSAVRMGDSRYSFGLQSLEPGTVAASPAPQPPAESNPGLAGVMLLRPDVQRALDAGWIKIWNQRVRSGERTTIADVRNTLIDAIDQIPVDLMTYRERGVLMSELDSQLFTVLDLSPDLVLFGGP